MNVVDSSGWLEFFADGPNADFFAPAIQDIKQLVVPALSIFEVFRRILQQRGEGEALQAIALMQQGTVVELTSNVALEAAKLSLEEKLPLADSIMLVTARAYDATMWTQDSDFENISGVNYVRR
jgi:predicted nucleic acid-binding protein